MVETKPDIQTEADVERMVCAFYAQVRVDAELGPIFEEVAKVDWEQHLPRMYGFWKKLILGEASYRGNPFAVHVPLPIDGRHFERWLALFEQSIDESFAGPVAEHTNLRARSIAHIFQSKLAFIHPTRKD